VKTLIVLLIPTALLGLGCGSSSKRLAPAVQIVTPDGFVLHWHDQGSRARGLDIAALYDEAVRPGALHLEKYGITPDQIRKALPSIKVHGIDDFMVPTQASETGYAAGGYDERYRILTLPLYSVKRLKADAPFPADAPPWTCRRRQQPYVDEAVCGELRFPFPALGHELGHHFFGGKFEHGWTPPLVSK